MIKDMVAQLLLKLGVIAMLAGVFPPAAHIYDLLTCSEADAVVDAVDPGGKARVAFTDSSGRRIVATAAPYHLSMGRHIFESGGGQAAYKRATFRASVGDTVRVIYRSANPISLAPHRNPTDALIGIGGIVLGALMLLARRAFMFRAIGRASSTPPRPARAGSVQRDRSWLGRA